MTQSSNQAIQQSSNPKVLVFGTICIDRIRRVPNLPEMGGYVEVQEEIDLLGGEAANTANALNAWGFEVVLVGNSLGSGLDGDHLRKLVADCHLQVYTDAGNQPTPVCDVYVTPDGNRTMFGKNFSIMEVGLQIPPIREFNAQWFTAEPNMEGLSRQVAREALKAGMRTYLMDFIQDDEPLGPGSFLQCSTDSAGHRGNIQKNVSWVQGMVDRNGCFVILSDGPNGFVAGSPELPVRAYPPYPAPNVVDTTGAGDMFRAGMLFGLNQDWPIHLCLQFASAAGCLKCRSLGATTDVPSVAEIQAHIASHSAISKQYH